jgi:hypothetical protein
LAVGRCGRFAFPGPCFLEKNAGGGAQGAIRGVLPSRGPLSKVSVEGFAILAKMR